MKKILIFLIFCLFINPFSQISANNTNNSSSVIDKLKTKQELQSEFQKDFNMQSPRLLKAKEELDNTNNKSLNEENSTLYTVLMYIPNRIVDLTDIVTFGLGFGPEASCEIVATEYFQFSAAYGDRYFIEKGYNRQNGGGYYSGHTVAGICWKEEVSVTDFTFGYVKPYVVLEDEFSIPDFKQHPYSNGIRDFWRIGIHLGWIVDLNISIHPVAIANFFTGFFFIRLTDTKEI